MSSNTLQKIEKFQYLGMIFTNVGKQNKEIGTRIGKANAVLREICRTVQA